MGLSEGGSRTFIAHLDELVGCICGVFCFYSALFDLCRWYLSTMEDWCSLYEVEGCLNHPFEPRSQS